MSKCNLLAPISRTTGNFLLFSQYAEDLTRSSQGEDFYRVTPSKYILLNLKSKEGWNAAKYAEVFQNYYENACAIYRSNPSIKWNPEYSQSVLWKTLFKFGLLEDTTTNPNGTQSTESVLYSGDINITSTRQYDGINYSEIYINVPSDSHRQRYEFSNYSSDKTKIVQYPYDYICGYPDSEYPSVAGEDWPSNDVNAEYSDSTVIVDGRTEYVYELFSSRDLVFDPEPAETLDDTHFTFNAVIVLYDISKRNMDVPEDTILYSGIPMGLYFTGCPDSDGNITNTVTVWNSHPDIYEQGTSYGFRICTRYLSTQNSLFIIDSSIADTDDMYDQYASAVGKLMESQSLMDGILGQIQTYQQNITNHLANTKTYRVNVPYIRNIGGRDFWFVNGRNLGVAVHKTDLVWENF